MNESAFLIFCAQQHYAESDINSFKKALDLSKLHLTTSQRLSGDTQYDHNLRVAIILADNSPAAEIIITGILQGILQYQTPKQLETQFTSEILHLLQELEGLKALKIKNKQLDAQVIRKIILTTLHDIRIIVIKLASKLDNLQTLHLLPQNEQSRIAEEVLEIYAPLANRLGMEKLRVQLEDSAFKLLNPQKYQEISNFLESSKEQRDKDIAKTVEEIKTLAIGKLNIIKIKGRSKHIYSIYKKLSNRGVKLDKQYDLLGIRILVETEKDCYTILGLLHEHFEPIEGRLKDYIANPKPNLYRSIHTGLKTHENRTLEVQIRTPEMDEFAEEGVAAHWKYKKVKSDELFEKKTAWLRSVLDLEKEGLLETVQVDLFSDTIQCYTPKGDVKELNKGATLLDFAYHVHQDIGDHCIGGRVNGKFVPLKHILLSGDVIEILTNKNQRPRRTWLKFVNSPRAKQKIRKSLKVHEQLPALHYRALKPVLSEEEGTLITSEEFPQAVCNIAKCCLPIPNQAITGIATKRRVISVHNQDCRLAQKEQARWVDVQWKETFNKKIRFSIDADERSGLLADLLHTIASAGFEVKEAKAKLLGSDRAECSFAVIPKDLPQLLEMIKRLKKIRGIRRLYFE